MENGVRKKVCMLGAYAVGKTSLTKRFVSDTFTPEYHTSIGVWVGGRDVAVSDREVGLLVWDIYGEDEFQEIRTTYLRGASGCMFVVDGTRPETLDVALRLREKVLAVTGPVPSLVLLNKSDLESTWEITKEEVVDAFGDAADVHVTSAKENLGVEEAFHEIARRILSTTCPTSPARS